MIDLWPLRTQKNSDDVVITCAIRTPLAKAFKGGLKDTQLDFMVLQTLQMLRSKSQLDPQLVEDICLGNVSLSGVNTTVSILEKSDLS